MKIQYVNFFEIFETGPAQICADLLEIGIDKKKYQMSMAVNQNYCQSCHLICRNGFIIRKIMSSRICCKCMGNVITLSECICSVQRVLQSDFRKDTILGQVSKWTGPDLKF
jgi:hypothetical protein